MRATPRGLALLLVVGASQAAAAPPIVPPGRPRVCLALSGGGARGGAHIGVLRVLERLHVPVDCIAGTSMGSIVGGLFAAGMNPEAIHNELIRVNWTDIMEDRPPRQDLPFRRKQDIASEFLNLELGFNGGKLNIPSGLISGRKIDYLLEKVTLDVKDLQSFDDLPTPFRSVTTDIGTGEMVVLSGGHLPTAIKASMNIPGAFAPVLWEGRQLVDGGLVRNLPVDVARSMHADVVIAVDVTTPLKDPNSIRNLADVAGQMSGMLTRENVGEQLKAADILIVPDLFDISTNAYDLINDAVHRGEDAASSKASELEKYALSASDYDAWLADRRREVKPPPVIDAIRVDGLSRVDPRIVDHTLSLEPGGQLDLHLLDRDLSRVYGLGDFQNVGFRVEEKDQKNTLVVTAREKPWGPGYMRFGLNFNVDLEGTSNFRVVARWNRTRINRLGAEWRNDVEIGETRQFISEFYQPLDFSGTWFVAGGGRVRYALEDIFDGDDKIAQYKTYEPVLAVMAGAQLSRYGEIRLGVARGLVRARPTVGDVNLPVVDEPTGAWIGRIVIDRLNETDFPTKGTYFRLGSQLSRHALGASFSYDKLGGEVFQVLTRGRYTVFMGMEGGTNLGTEIPFFDQFAIGGLLSLSGFSEQQLRGQVFGVARLGYYRAQGKLSGLFGTRVFFGGWLEAGNVWESFSSLGDSGAHYTATVSLSARTLLGPLYVAYGYATEGNGAVYITMGRSFGGRGAFDIGLN